METAKLFEKPMKYQSSQLLVSNESHECQGRAESFHPGKEGPAGVLVRGLPGPDPGGHGGDVPPGGVGGRSEPRPDHSAPSSRLWWSILPVSAVPGAQPQRPDLLLLIRCQSRQERYVHPFFFPFLTR